MLGKQINRNLNLPKLGRMREQILETLENVGPGVYADTRLCMLMLFVE